MKPKRMWAVAHCPSYPFEIHGTRRKAMNEAFKLFPASRPPSEDECLTKVFRCTVLVDDKPVRQRRAR